MYKRQGIRSLSAYIRKMALDGYCLNLDLPQLRRMAYLLQLSLIHIYTGVRRNSRDPEVWQYNDDLKQPVSEMLAATYLSLIHICCEQSGSPCEEDCKSDAPPGVL